MQITLDHTEIEKAIKQYVVTHAMPQSNAQITVVMKAGRGDRGYSCIVTIASGTHSESTVEVKQTKATKPSPQIAASESPDDADDSTDGSNTAPRSSIFNA